MQFGREARVVEPARARGGRTFDRQSTGTTGAGTGDEVRTKRLEGTGPASGEASLLRYTDELRMASRVGFIPKSVSERWVTRLTRRRQKELPRLPITTALLPDITRRGAGAGLSRPEGDRRSDFLPYRLLCRSRSSVLSCA